MRWLKTGLIALAVILIVAIIGFVWFLSKAAPIGTGYVAKYLCSSTFISERDPDIVFEEDIKPVNPLASFVDWKIDHEARSVTGDMFGFFSLKAIYRDGSGCSLVIDTTEEEMRRQKLVSPDIMQTRPRHPDTMPWPLGSQGPVDPASLGINTDALNKALDYEFSEPGPEKQRLTRAVVVVYYGHLVAERYAPGFTKDTPILSWSMSKSVTSALVGILVKEGRLDIYQPAPVPEWSRDDDPRKKITTDQLLRMSSGLEFDETYAPLHDATYMLYGSYDFAAYAAEKQLKTDPDGEWYYSSGTANITARIVRGFAEKEYEYYYDFMYEKLFDKIGMYSALVEPDSSGTFVGSSYAVATPRDWARFGQFYLQDGVWQGERILPEGWVEYSTTPTPKAPQGEYGAYFWLNAGSPSDPGDRPWPSAPPDAFAASGFQQQRVIVIPSKNLVLVRFGATSSPDAWSVDEFVKQMLAALPAGGE